MVFSHSSNSLINSNEHCICKVLVVTRSAYLFTDFDKIPKSAGIDVRLSNMYCISWILVFFLVFGTNSRRLFQEISSTR